MKALIFNSGIGKRMGELTKNSPKSMVKLLNGETVFERQIRILSECGIKEFIITTGPFEEQLKQVCAKKCYRNLKFVFVHNNLFDQTNYIYSFYLAREYIDDDFLTLHGDLVFNKRLVLAMLKDNNNSLGLINKHISLPEKDFKGRVIDDKLLEVGINIFDDNCFAFQPLYKLSKKDILLWVNNIVNFIENKKINQVYAENAFNEISSLLNIVPFEYDDYYINEIDNVEDYQKVSKEIELVDYKDQEIFNSITDLEGILKRYNIKKPFVVMDRFLRNSFVDNYLKQICDPYYFTSFKANPLYEDVLTSLKEFKNNNCDGIISLGGGSAIDTAKALKLFLPLNENELYLNQKHKYIYLKHIAIPTTAGTGSESTRYAVIYYEGKKQSLTDDLIVPDVAILETEFLKTLPINQKKATVFDALCQGIESMWSINSTTESKEYSKRALKIILKNLDKYLNGDSEVLNEIILSSNYSGKAINITQTTAAHALSYKITSLFNVPHGQAVALCLPHLWKYLKENVDNTFDYRGKEYVKNILTEIDELFACENAYEKFYSLLEKYEMLVDIDLKEDELDLLINSVNIERLRNFPIELNKDIIKEVYLKALRK